jgi:hypothetical protein
MVVPESLASVALELLVLANMEGAKTWLEMLDYAGNSRFAYLDSPQDDLWSLIANLKSLIVQINSLLVWLGNSLRSRCSTALSDRDFSYQSPRFVKFPVKFPVSREFVGRPVRSALRRQPGILDFREFLSNRSDDLLASSCCAFFT